MLAAQSSLAEGYVNQLRYLTLPEVAALCRASKSSIRVWVRIGTFPRPTKIGGRCLWPIAVVEAYLRQREETATHAA
jgi:predicted DNA-binding transcriptional regulator AlpA